MLLWLYHDLFCGVCWCSLGANVVIGDIDDPHRQEFLRAHDEEISALQLSASGLLIASGQHGSTRSPVRCGSVAVVVGAV